MGFTARKSFKVMPEVRMTVSKSGVSTSVGVRGARVTRTASGRTTTSVGIPGSGIRYSASSSGNRSRNQTSRSAGWAAPVQPSRTSPIKPGFTSPKWEKELFKVVTGTEVWSRLPEIARTYPEAALAASAIEAFKGMSESDATKARSLDLMRWVHAQPEHLELHPFVRKYLPPSTVTLGIAEGVEVTLPLCDDAVGLALVELEQYAGNIDQAIAVAESLEPSQIAAVSLCELYLQRERFSEVVDLTNGITNTDDESALLVTFRGMALHGEGMLTAAREAFKEALKSKSRDAGIRHMALCERSLTYVAEGKKAMARKDLERVMAENAAYPGVREAFAALD